MSNKILLNLSNSLKASKQNKIPIIEIKFSRKVLNVISILLKEGLIRGYFLKNTYTICILLKYVDDQNIVIFKNNSLVNQKNYFAHKIIQNNFMSFNSCIISTRKGVFCHRDALNRSLGGFILLNFF